MSLPIRLYSDLHNEFRKDQLTGVVTGFDIPVLDTDSETVLVLAGDVDSDINRLCDYLAEQAKRFRSLSVVHARRLT